MSVESIFHATAPYRPSYPRGARPTNWPSDSSKSPTGSCPADQPIVARARPGDGGGIVRSAGRRRTLVRSALLTEVQHAEDLVVAVFADGDEVGQAAVFSEAQ